MKWLQTIEVLLTLSVLAAAAFHDECYAQQSDASGEPAPAVAHLELLLPNAMSSEDITFYCDVLEVDGDLQGSMVKILQAHIGEVQDCLNSDGKRLVERSCEIGDAATPGYAGRLAEVLKERDKLVAKIGAIDRRCFDQIVVLLPEEKVVLLDSLRLDRERQRCTAGQAYTSRRIARVDLAAFFRDAMKAEDVANQTKTHAVTLEYDAALVPLLRAKCRDLSDAMIRDNELLTQVMGSDNSYDAAARHTLLVSERQKIWNAQDDLDRRIAAVNNAFVPKFLATLEEEASDRSADLLKVRCYPEIYPDLLDADRALELAGALPDLSQDQRDTLSALLVTHRDTYESQCRSMHKKIDAWVASVAVSRSYDARDLQQYKDELEELKNDRRESSLKYIQMVVEILSPEQVDVLKAQTAIAVGR